MCLCSCVRVLSPFSLSHLLHQLSVSFSLSSFSLPPLHLSSSSPLLLFSLSLSLSGFHTHKFKYKDTVPLDKAYVLTPSVTECAYTRAHAHNKHHTRTFTLRTHTHTKVKRAPLPDIWVPCRSLYGISLTLFVCLCCTVCSQWASTCSSCWVLRAPTHVRVNRKRCWTNGYARVRVRACVSLLLKDFVRVYVRVCMYVCVQVTQLQQTMQALQKQAAQRPPKKEGLGALIRSFSDMS